MIVSLVSDYILQIMGALGYGGLFLMMAMESMVFPVPSEVVMPFAGFLVEKGDFTFAAAAAVSGLGTVFGSLLSYWMGLFGGRAFIRRYGRYLFLDESHLDWTEKWFSRHGEKTVFVARFIPVVRHLISIPCGLGRMRYPQFLAYTLAGGLVWNTFLLWVGVKIGERWELVHRYSEKVDIVFLALLLGLGGYVLAKHLRHSRGKFRG